MAGGGGISHFFWYNILMVERLTQDVGDLPGEENSNPPVKGLPELPVYKLFWFGRTLQLFFSMQKKIQD